MIAGLQATLHNAHFDSKGIPWTAEDMMGKGNREQRKAQQLEDRMISIRIQRKIMTATDDDLPQWAKDLTVNKQKVN